MSEQMTSEKVRKMLGATAFIDPPDAAQDMKDLCYAYLSLLDERDQLREALEDIYVMTKGSTTYFPPYRIAAQALYPDTGCDQ